MQKLNQTLEAGWVGFCRFGNALLVTLALGGLMWLGSGCSTTGMKGTPFYTGEDVKYTAPVEDRVVFWPLFYNRDPVLSVLWPLYERNDHFMAVRPFFSAYDRQYNVLWPLAQFDRGAHENRIFPFFWGGGAQPADDYCVGFPLYWGFGHPLDDTVGGLNTLFPLWWVDRHGPDKSSVFCPWPLVHFMQEGKKEGWHVFPLAGSYGDDNQYFRFQAAFLADQWGNYREDRHGSLLLPLYFYGRNKEAWDFYSLPWSGGHDADSDWSCLLPVYYHRTNTTGSLFLSPLWLQGTSAYAADGGWAALLPLLYHSYNDKSSTTLSPLWLSHWASDPNEKSWSALLPVFYHSANKDSDLLLTPLWQQGSSANPAEGGWKALLPLLYHSYSDKASTTLSPLWLSHWASDPNEKSWSALLPLYYHSANKDSDLFLSPLWQQGSSANPAEGGWKALLPLLYHSYNDKASTTLSPLWLSHLASDPNQKSWSALLPAYYHSANKDSDLLLTPLWSQGASSNANWQFLLPLYYAQQDGADKFWATPLGGLRTDAGQRTWMIYPLLSWGTPRADGGEFWALAPLIHADWNASNSVSHAFPFYYYNSATRTALSPLWSRWSSGGTTNSVVPPALSWVSSDAASSDLWLALGLGKFSWGEKPGADYLLPLFYHDREKQMFLSPAWSRWSSGGTTNSVVPPALSWVSSDANSSDFWLALGLGKFSWGAKPGADYLMPLFYHDREKQLFLSPAWSRWTTVGSTTTLIPPLLSWISSDKASSDLWLALGLGKFSWGEKPGSQWLLPLFYHDREKELFLSPLWAEWKSGADSTTLIPPILSWKNTQPERSDLWLTLGLGRFSWGEKAGSQWLLPLFYQDRNEKTFISPLWAHWPSPDGENSAVPLALSWLTSDEQSKNFWLALGLGKFSWGEKPSSSYLFPFYYHDPRSREFYSLLYGSDPSSDGFTYFATPLVGKRNGEQHAGSWVFPLYSHKRDVKTDEVNDWLLWGNHWERNGVSRSIFIPLFGYHNFGDRDALPARVTAQEHRGKDFFCIPYCWYQNETYVRCAPGSQNNNPPVREDKFTHGVFPLWSYADVDNPAEGRKNTDGSCLLWLYDYTREVGPLANAPAGTNDYTRARVLWHLWHYERLNGDVSVDVFPGITYDRKNDGFKKISWLWRLFRYERDKNGGVDLDILFIPFRQGAEKRK